MEITRKENTSTSEERVLHFETCTVRLCYLSDGEVEMLRFELPSGSSIVIRRASAVEAPERIYELLRECGVSVWEC